MNKELISAMIDSELEDAELKQLNKELESQDEHQLVSLYHMIGNAIRQNQSGAELSSYFPKKIRLKLQQEYMQSGIDGQPASAIALESSQVDPRKEESIA